MMYIHIYFMDSCEAHLDSCTSTEGFNLIFMVDSTFLLTTHYSRYYYNDDPQLNLSYQQCLQYVEYIAISK